MFVSYCTKLLLVILLVGCNLKSDYQKMHEKELSSGIRQDSLFLGISFGMSDTDFYSRCAELNQQGIFRQGPQSASVEFDILELKYSAKMVFYPNFHKDKIYEIPATFSYNGWAPWNKHLSEDSLRVEVLELFEKWYGKGFIEVQNPGKSTTYVKIDGNRQIEIYEPEYDNEVVVRFTNLMVEKIKEKKQ